MSFATHQIEPKPALYAYLTVGAFAFVVGALVTLQFATLKDRAGLSGLTKTTALAKAASAQAPVTRQTAQILAVPNPELSDVTATPNTANIAAQTKTVLPENFDKSAKVKEANAIVLANNMRMLTEGVVAGLYDIQDPDASGQGVGRILLNSRNAGDTANRIQDMLAEAAALGNIAVPEELVLESGGIDSRTLLLQLVQNALEEGDADAMAAARDMRRRAFAASEATTQEQNGQRFYVVERGDSLAYIALQFYGQTGMYDKIFQANQDVLTSPDKIRVGQRLRIPS